MTTLNVLHWFHLFLHVLVFIGAVTSCVKHGQVRGQHVIFAIALVVVPAAAIGNGTWTVNDWLGGDITYAVLMAWCAVFSASLRVKAKRAAPAP